MIRAYLEHVKSGKIDIVDYVTKALDSCKKINSEYNYFNVICEKEAIEQAKSVSKKLKEKKAGKLAGLIVSIKDNICVKGVESTATSRILKNYKPLFDSTVVERLKKEDAIIIGKTSCDEFGFGSFNVNVGLDYKIPKNPFDRNRTTGGSSGGSGGITQKADFVHVSIAESTGGSIECPAAFCGVIGFCPTYGFVSRNGLISYANSFDKIGIMAKDAEDIRLVMDVISGTDESDSTSLKLDKAKILNEISGKKIMIGLIKEAFGEGLDEEVNAAARTFIEKMKEQGYQVEEVSLPLTYKYGIAVYYILTACEASTNLACLCGLRYGQESNTKCIDFDSYFSDIRTKHFNMESKRRILLGTFARMAGYRDAYYIRATKIRTKIIEEYKELFKKYDFLISPTMPILPPKFSDIAKMEPLKVYLSDVLTVGPNLAGIPHISIPVSQKKPVGLMLMADHLKDGKLINFTNKLEAMK